MEAVATAQPQVAAASPLTSLARAWDLLIAITARNLKVRYQGMVLSYLWWIARPLTMGLVLYFALGKVLQLRVPDYSIFLMTGIFPWFWFSGAVQQGASSVLNGRGLLKKVQFPRLILPLSAVLFNTAQFIFTLPILFIFLIVGGYNPTPAWLVGIPMMIALQLLLVTGLGTLVGSLSVFVRDLRASLDVLMLLLFYTSAVLFPLDRVPEVYQPYLKLSPVTTLLEGWRTVFLEGALPGVELWPTLAGTAVLLGLGLLSFRALERYFADAL